MHSIDDLRPIIERVRTDITAIKTKDGTSIWCKNEPLTSERIQAHLNGTQLRGVCPIKEGEDTTMLALLDLDSHKGETSWGDMLQVAQDAYDAASKHGIYFEGFHSSGGKGVHLIAIWDEPQDAYSVREVLREILESFGFKSGAGGVAKKEIEIFPKQSKVSIGGCGNQFILPFSPKGVPIADPQWIKSLPVERRVKPAPQPKEYARYDDKDEMAEAVSALKAISPDISYPEWVDIGMGLKDKFGNAGFQLWDTWSSGGVDYEAGEMWKKWQSFRNEGVTIATMYGIAMLNGWRHEPITRPEVDVSITEKIVGQIVAKKEANHPTKANSAHAFGFDILNIKGFVGETIRQMDKYALYKQPELYLLNTLVAAGAVFGRRYASPMNARTNLYMIGIARTAGGKDFSRQYISLLFEKAGLQDFTGAHYIRSDTGMLVNLQNKPSQILMLDEFGMYLEAVTNPRAPSHLRNISSCITRIFTCSGNFYDHGQTADSKSKIVIMRPNLCIYGTTTEGSYAAALKRSAVGSGELNRFLVYKSDRSFTGREDMPPSFEIDNDLADAWSRFSDGVMTANLNDLPPEPIEVTWDDEIKSMIQDCSIKQNTMINEKAPNSELWGRYAELVTKIAMIFAISENKTVPYFKPWHIEYARNIVDTCLDYMANLANESVSDSDYEESQQKVLKYLKGKKGGVTMTELNNRFRSLKAKERREMLIDMIGQGVIAIDKKGDKHKPKEVVRVI